MSNQDTVVRLMLVDDKLEDAEHSISLLRNGGIAVRPSRPESPEELEAALAGSGSDLILAAYSARTIPFADVVKATTASGKDVNVVALLDQLDEASVLDVMAQGASGFSLRGRAAHLQAIVRREARIGERRRLVRRLEAALR